MKNSLILLISLSFFSCSSEKNPGEKDLLRFNSFPLEVPEVNSLMSEWEKKPVLETRLIDDMEQETGWKVKGIGEMSYTSDRAKDGKRSLRFRTSLRDTAFYRLPGNRSEWNSFIGTQGGSTSLEMKIDSPRDWSGYNRLSFWVYVHPTSLPTYCLYLQMENEGTLYNATTPRKDHFIQDLKPGMWNHVLFEISHLQRNKVNLFKINQMLTGHNPGEEGIVIYDIDQLELQRVSTDQYEGWSVSPEKFAFSHVGYRPGDSKIAMVGKISGKNFQLIDQNDKVVFTGDIRMDENKNGIFNQLDFSDFRNEGVYRLRCGSMESKPFPIDKNVWIQPIYKALNFFFCERCGFNVPGIHTECHKDWQGFRGEEKKIINGGWHDAGDLSQGSFRTSMSVYAMILNLEELQGQKDMKELADLMRSEIVWGLEWLLKTRFGDGYHMSFSVMRIYTDNKTGTIDDVVSPAKNVPWENFLASAAQCKAARILEKSHPELARKANDAAIEDWNAAYASRTSWDQADYREAAWGVTSSILLWETTGDSIYREQAVLFGNLLMKCQEQNFVDGIPVTGYFYENTETRKAIHNYHHSTEESPLIALSMLCRSFPENENWINWYSAVVLHSEFFMKRGSQISSPYNLLPNSVWKKSEIMLEKDTAVRRDMLRQFNDGTRLKEEYVLRTFPIYRDNLFHGSTMIHMASTWALAEASRLRKDSSGMQLAGKQLQWILGDNPFGQSLMYGVGYDFAPQFAYCLKDIVGSLPVGMDCMSGDMPHWSSTNTATSKEIWVEPVNRFMGAVSIYSSENNLVSGETEPDSKIHIQTETISTDNGTISISVTLTGTGTHEVEIKSFNAKTNINKQKISLRGNTSEKLQLELTVTDRNKPYVAVISADKNPDLRKEITGSFNNVPF